MKSKPFLEDQLAPYEPPLQSAVEQQIGRLLDSYDLPFFYRQPTIVTYQGKNQLFCPAFTLPQHGGFVIDYLAPSNSEDPHPDPQDRHDIYRYNQIPAYVLGPRDLDKPNWQQSLYELIQKLNRQPYQDYLAIADSFNE